MTIMEQCIKRVIDEVLLKTGRQIDCFLIVGKLSEHVYKTKNISNVALKHLTDIYISDTPDRDDPLLTKSVILIRFFDPYTVHLTYEYSKALDYIYQQYLLKNNLSSTKLPNDTQFLLQWYCTEGYKFACVTIEPQ